jgi:hypothetical protein
MVLSFCVASECQWPEYRSSTRVAPASPGPADFCQQNQYPAAHVSNASEKANAAFMILT